jgi:ADP-ribosylglycohydrolase
MENKIISSFLGLAVGDALGVPVEFKPRQVLKENPVTGMRAYGTHQQPAGTWSDDSSMAFCTAEALCQGFQIKVIARNFVAWYEKAYWAAHHEVFDIGIATSKALEKIKQGISPSQSGGATEYDNGNGSLMRILPLVFELQNDPIDLRFTKIQAVSSITHAHLRSVLACFMYCEYALALLQGQDKMQAYATMQSSVNSFLDGQPDDFQTERTFFARLLTQSIDLLNEDDIQSSGYVLHTLEAALWCLLTTDSYADAVLKAVNLGEDTDTTACVAGGLAGLYYGADKIPAPWLAVLARKDDIVALAQRLAAWQANRV